MNIPLLIAVLIGGIVAGRFLQLPIDSRIASEWVLLILLVLVGILLGADRRALQAIFRVGFRFLLIPLAIAAGSIAGAAVAGLLGGMPVHEAAAVGGGFGWYSLSSVILANSGYPQAGAVALMSNIMREVIALATIPLLARKFGAYFALAPAGATAMDVTLPLIVRSSGAAVGLLAFASGALLSLLVPVVVPLLVRLGG